MNRLEQITSQCPCGLPLIAVISESAGEPAEARIFRLDKAGAACERITRCPVCDRDFSRLTPADIKERSWGS
jgi:hypothetical protein